MERSIRSLNPYVINVLLAEESSLVDTHLNLKQIIVPYTKGLGKQIRSFALSYHWNTRRLIITSWGDNWSRVNFHS